MPVTLITQCRLCGVRFEEALMATFEGELLGHSGRHPIEDGNPWCDGCKAALNGRMEILLGDNAAVASF